MIKKMNYKKVVIALSIFSAFFLIIFIDEPIENYIKTIIISLSINIISSNIIIFMIDIKKENEEKKQMAERRKIIYKSLIPPLRDYNTLIYNLYKATTKKEKIKVKYFNNNSLNADKIFENVKLLDIEKVGCRYNRNKKNCLIWKEIIINDFISYIDELKRFYNNNSQFIDNELSEMMYKIISQEKCKNICNFMLDGTISTDINDMLQLLHLKDIYITTKEIEKNIEKYISINDLKVEKSSIMQENVAPKYGSGIKKVEKGGKNPIDFQK